MIDWYQQKNLLLLVICACWSKQPLVADALVSNGRFLPDQKIATADWTAQVTLQCETINPAYQEIYSFETEDYYINICQLDNEFYYHRQSKLDQSIILIPAQAVFSGDVFQATDGKINYFVGKNGDRYYSSVMKNNNEIIFEPELPQSPTQSQDLAEANSNLPQDFGANQTNNASLELDSSDNVSEQVLICTKEKSAFHPHLDGWQKLIGKPTAVASRYAVNNGHDFVYDEQTPELALINTKDGAIINLSIAAGNETISEVCIESESKEDE